MDISQMTDAELQAAVLPVANCNLGPSEGTAFISQQLAFFNDISNMPYVRQAAQLYPIITSCPARAKGQAYYQFFWACYYFKQFNMPYGATLTCDQMQSTISGLQAQIVNVKQRGAPGGDLGNLWVYHDSTLEQMLSTVQGLYSSNQCDQAINNEQQSQQIGAISQVAAAAAPVATSNTTQYIMYGIAAIAVIAAIIVLAKKKKS